jgi:hypothetical protein
MEDELSPHTFKIKKLRGAKNYGKSGTYELLMIKEPKKTCFMWFSICVTLRN